MKNRSYFEEQIEEFLSLENWKNFAIVLGFPLAGYFFLGWIGALVGLMIVWGKERLDNEY